MLLVCSFDTTEHFESVSIAFSLLHSVQRTEALSFGHALRKKSQKRKAVATESIGSLQEPIITWDGTIAAERSWQSVFEFSVSLCQGFG